MGHGITQLLAMSGIEVTMVNIIDEFLQKRAKVEKFR